MSAPDFWNEPSKAQAVNQDLVALKEKVKQFSNLVGDLEELKIFWELALEESDESLVREIQDGLHSLKERLEKMELEVLLNGPHDSHNAIVSLHAGAGGTEAQDWVQMLLRMYTRWAEQRHFKVEVLDSLPGDEAGIKNITFLIRGKNAYGYLKAEEGVHRLIRISPFDASRRRHTSFASLEVLPEVEKDEEVDIKSEDIKIDTYRAGGAGGQHVNKTDSAVRITHLPTGIVVQCQNERSQHANRLSAMKILRAKLLELQAREKEEQLAEIRGEQEEIGWGRQIRTYTFQPYTMVKDHRTGMEIGNVQAVMDGDIQPLIAAYLQQKARVSS